MLLVERLTTTAGVPGLPSAPSLTGTIVTSSPTIVPSRTARSRSRPRSAMNEANPLVEIVRWSLSLDDQKVLSAATKLAAGTGP